jgi:hypothetical protein
VIAVARALPVAVARPVALALPVALGSVLLAPAPAGAQLARSDNTPFPASRLIVGAAWTSPQYLPPKNQWGDILPTIWADDGNQYTMMDDGGTDTPAKAYWKQSVAQITGNPPAIRFHHVGNPTHPAPATRVQIHANHALWSGPLGPYYSDGLVEADHVFFAPQQLDWDWNADDPFTGLAGIAYSTDRGQTWESGGHPFPAPIGNLSWVIRGRGGVYPDGWVYAIDTEREFNASDLIMGRSRPDIADMTNPASWQWVSGWAKAKGQTWPQWSSSVAAAAPIARWNSHVTYPQMAYDSPLHQYLLTFTWSYAAAPPAMWRNGSELVILTAPHPWGPFRFVARQVWFGPSNGYSPGVPVKWISRDGRDVWLKWAANFDGCAKHLRCWGGYGFNYRRLHLTLAGDKPPSARRHRRLPARGK